MIRSVWWIVGLGGLGYWLFIARRVVGGLLRPRRLSAVTLRERPIWPRVSVIVPARNEEAALEGCLKSLLGQDYQQLEIVALDDRSTDASGQVMDDLAAIDPRLEVIHVKELPAEWLGKSHANFLGAAAATGDWILFTDGDIIFSPQVLKLAIAHVEAEGLDHLSLFPGLVCHGPLEKAAICTFGLILSAFLKVRDIRNPLKPKSFCGIGAFNLVRASAYRSMGGHERLRMEVADDVKLGKLMKMHGYTSDLLEAADLLSLRWQNGFLGVIGGLEKNGFAGSDFRTAKAFGGILALTAVVLLPLIGVILAPGLCRIPYAVWLMSQLALLGLGAAVQGSSPLLGLLFPVASLGIVYAILRSVVLALVRGGIYWRETFHSLKELRRGVV